MKRLLLVVGVLIAGFLGGLYSISTVTATRNSAGTNTLPSGNPVTTGTTISSTWANNTLGDISTELTNSLDRYGRGGMLASLKGVNGTETAPTFSFTNDSVSGMYRRASNDIGFSVGGTERFGMNGDGFYLRDSGSAYGVFLRAGFSGGNPTLTDNQFFTFPSTTPDSTLPISMNSSGGMTTAQITTAQIASGAITRALLPTVGQQVSASCGTFAMTLSSMVDVTNLHVTITTTGRPVHLLLIPDGDLSVESSIKVTTTSAGTGGAIIVIVRGSTTIANFGVAIGTGASTGGTNVIPPSSISFLDVVGAGTYTYKIQAYLYSPTGSVTNAKLVAYEL